MHLHTPPYTSIQHLQHKHSIHFKCARRYIHQSTTPVINMCTHIQLTKKNSMKFREVSTFPKHLCTSATKQQLAFSTLLADILVLVCLPTGNKERKTYKTAVMHG